MIDISLFEAVISKDRLRQNEPMSKHTTFKTGGNADLMALPSQTEEIIGIINICKANNIPYYVIGNGSNLLVSDRGIRGVVIKLGTEFSQIRADNNIITAQAGALLSAVAQRALREELKGMEFAAGIPGSIGGGICMNAGAYGGELKDIVKEVKVLYKGEVKALSNEECGFGYRHSRIMEEGMIVLEVKLKLEKGNPSEIKAVMDDLALRRREKQPLDKPSAGSTFKRPEGNFAGKLIEEAGLKGFSIGGAQVSEKHCGFVVNTGKATTDDILSLINSVKERVYQNSGIMLEPEVRFLGEL